MSYPKVGGFDLAALTGFFLGGAAVRLPIVIDGFISGTAALDGNEKSSPDAVHYMLPSHKSKGDRRQDCCWMRLVWTPALTAA